MFVLREQPHGAAIDVGLVAPWGNEVSAPESVRAFINLDFGSDVSLGANSHRVRGWRVRELRAYLWGRGLRGNAAGSGHCLLAGRDDFRR